MPQTTQYQAQENDNFPLVKRGGSEADGVFPPDWQEVRLGDVVEMKNEKFKMKNLTLDNYVSTENMLSDRLGVQKSANLPNVPSVNTFKVGDTLFSNIRTYFKKVWFSKFDGGASNDVLIFTPKDNNKLDKKFLYYIISNDKFIDFTVISSKGTKMPRGDKEAMKNLPIFIPPLLEQKAIAGILSSLDDKIELLRNQNQTLENLGQRLFEREMEVGGEFEESRLGDLGQIVCGKTPSTADPENFDGEIPFIKIPDMHGQMFVIKTNQTLSKVGANTQKNKFIPTNSLCVSCIATVGVISITTEPSQTNQQINSIVPENPQILEWLYYSILNRKSDLMALGAGGAVTLNVNTNLFSNFKIKIPSKPQLEAFHNLVSPLFSKILANTQQIQTLSKIRDTLLPELMAGRRRVEVV